MAKRVVLNGRTLLLVTMGWMAVALPVFGQAAAAAVNAPEYVVVAIRPNKSGSGAIRFGGGSDRYSATNIPINLLIQYAYDLKTTDLVSGLPGWADSARFDVEAKMDEETIAVLNKLPPEERIAQRQSMMQSLLTDRFQLKVRHVSKELPIYALVVAKSGLKLKDANPNNTEGAHAGMTMSLNGQFTAQAIPISALAANLSARVDRTVVDKTGLTGRYDIALQWAPDATHGPTMADDQGTAPSERPSIFTALQEQLGLKLEATKGPVDTIVVDHVEMPSEN
jgi:uncharacterized protein (TIGR03435 family)